MQLEPDAQAADRADLERRLEQARQEAAYYREIAQETGKSHLRNMHQLSGLVADLRDIEQRLRESESKF
jgi:uncharacterized protein YceH (UPF0502 family)